MNSTTCTTLPELQSQGEQLLEAIWPSNEGCRFISSRDKRSNCFINHAVSSATEAVRKAYSLSSEGLDVYFACGIFATHQNRTASNAIGARAFWIDIDCGQCKAESGHGYDSESSARKALTDFCTATGLPAPTHIISSGSGIHAYWALSTILLTETWQKFAKKLKTLCKRCGFGADPSRTADIASLLRIPGSLNYKYSPPRAVTLLSASQQCVETSHMLEALDRAYDKHCSATGIEAPTAGTMPSNGSFPYTKSGYLDLAFIASALLELDPDCSEETWKLRRIAPLANESRRHPVLTEQLYTLAKLWSSGDLRGEPSIAWRTPGGNGLSGEQVFDSTWERFLHSNYQGRLVGIGTIYYDAKQSGWEPTAFEEFSVIENTEGEK